MDDGDVVAAIIAVVAITILLMWHFTSKGKGQ